MIEVRLEYQHFDYLNDVQDIPRAFSPYLIINEKSDNYLKWNYRYSDNIFTLIIESNLWDNEEKSINVLDADLGEYKKITKRFIKNTLYDYLSSQLQIKLLYGSLTGVRPTKLYYELAEKLEDVEKYMVDKFSVSPQKAELIANCVKNQKNHINLNKNNVGLFLNIPFCPTRCSYCSFISTEVFRIKKELPYYVECVKKEWNSIFEIITKNGYNVRTIYVGGGTPTSVGSRYLDEMLTPLKDFGVEFTVEAGRPDTITDEIIEVLLKNNVTRISINPQTFKQKTLDIIGRKHTVDDIYKCFEKVKNSGLDVNADLIAGLPEEKIEDFCDSVDKCIALSPDNITIHTLSFKRGSVMTVEGMQKKEFGSTEKMINYGHNALKSAGYLPYYMYRQKNMCDNLENTGYCKPGKQCDYNIDMMEEASSIIAAGAGGMSKKINGLGRIDRLSNPKGFREYIERIDSVINNKKLFF